MSTFFFFNDTATTEIYTLSLHDALPILLSPRGERNWDAGLGVMAGFTSRGFSNGPNIHARPCPHARWPVRQPGADSSMRTAVAEPFNARRWPDAAPPRRRSARDRPRTAEVLPSNQ